MGARPITIMSLRSLLKRGIEHTKGTRYFNTTRQFTLLASRTLWPQSAASSGKDILPHGSVAWAKPPYRHVRRHRHALVAGLIRR